MLAFVSYVAQFETDAAANGRPTARVNIAIQFVPLTGELGHCRNGAISIDPTSWQAIGDSGRQMLIYHELGHCFLGRAHLPDVRNGRPVSIMISGMPNTDQFVTWKAEYIQELFQ